MPSQSRSRHKARRVSSGTMLRSTVEQRIAWEDLPDPLKEAIEARTGLITAARTMTAGQNSPLAAVLDTAAGRGCVKGLPSDHRKVITQDREAALASLVEAISPPCCGTSTKPDGTSSASSTHLAATPTTAQARPTSIRLAQLMQTLASINVPADPGPSNGPR